MHTVAGYMLYAATTFKYVFDHKPETDIFWCTADIGWITGHTCVVYGPLLNGGTSVFIDRRMLDIGPRPLVPGQPPASQFTVAHPPAIKRQSLQLPARAVLGISNSQPTKPQSGHPIVEAPQQSGNHSASQRLERHCNQDFRINGILVTRLLGCLDNRVTGLWFGGLGIGETKHCPGWQLEGPAFDGWRLEGVPTHPHGGRIWDIVDKYGITHLYTAPTAIRLLMKLGDALVKKYSRKSLRLLATAGETINPAAWLWFYEVVGEKRCPVVDTFWQTETGGPMVTSLPGAHPAKPGSVVRRKSTSSRGGSLCKNLLHRRSIVRGRKSTSSRGGSLCKNLLHRRSVVRGARRDEDGYIWMTGRIDDMLNVSGHLLSTAEVESCLAGHPDIAEAAAVSTPHVLKGESIYCFITPKDGVAFDDRLVAALKARVEAHSADSAKPSTSNTSANGNKTTNITPIMEPRPIRLSKTPIVRMVRKGDKAYDESNLDMKLKLFDEAIEAATDIHSYLEGIQVDYLEEGDAHKIIKLKGELNILATHNSDSLAEEWQLARPSQKTVLGVQFPDFKPHTPRASEIPTNNKEKGKNANAPAKDEEIDYDEESAVQQEIKAYATGQSILKGETLTVFIQNYQRIEMKTFCKFKPEGDIDQDFDRVWSYFKPIHLAPVTDFTPKERIRLYLLHFHEDALQPLRGLDRKTKERDYLNLVRKTFYTFGKVEVNNLKRGKLYKILRPSVPNEDKLLWKSDPEEMYWWYWREINESASQDEKENASSIGVYRVGNKAQESAPPVKQAQEPQPVKKIESTTEEEEFQEPAPKREKTENSNRGSGRGNYQGGTIS
ncbi:unnamed protein product, partial [Notodromas monacha]